MPLIEHRTSGDGMQVAAERAGINYDSLRQAIGRGNSMSFRRADRLLCSMRLQHLWQSEPLNYYYWDGQVPPDLSKPVKCANPRCDEWFSLPEEVPAGAGRGDSEAQAARARWAKRHCSETCALMNRRIKRRETFAPGEELRTFECEFCHATVSVERKFGGGAAKKNRRACESVECKRALKTALMREYRARAAA